MNLSILLTSFSWIMSTFFVCNILAVTYTSMGYSIQIPFHPKDSTDHGEVHRKTTNGEEWWGCGHWFGRKSHCSLLWSWIGTSYKWDEDRKSFVHWFSLLSLLSSPQPETISCPGHHMSLILEKIRPLCCLLQHSWRYL